MCFLFVLAASQILGKMFEYVYLEYLTVDSEKFHYLRTTGVRIPNQLKILDTTRHSCDCCFDNTRRIISKFCLELFELL